MTASQEDMKGTVRTSQEMLEATVVKSIQSELEELIRNWVEDSGAPDDQWTKGLHGELNAAIVTSCFIWESEASVSRWRA